MCGKSGPSSGPLCAFSQPHLGGGMEGAARGHAERREFSGLLLSVLLSFTVSVRRAVGHSPSPLFTPSVRNENHRRTFLGWGSLFPAFLFLLLFLNQNQVYSQSVPLPQVPKCWPLHRAVQLLHLLAPHPGASCCFRQWYFVICPVPRLHGSVTGFRSLWVCSLSLPLSHSLSLSKVCDFKQLLLTSVSHWCRSFLYCKETYLRLLIAVWFRVFPQTPFVLWDQ